jgi:hypothetical protein
MEEYLGLGCGRRKWKKCEMRLGRIIYSGVWNSQEIEEGINGERDSVRSGFL